MKVFFDALGCPKALVDAEKMCAYLFETGEHRPVYDPEEADAIIVNTCGFIESAKQESIDAILSHAELKKTKPDLVLVVSGCMVARYHEDLKREIPEIDAFIGVKDPSKIKDIFITNKNKSMLDQGEYKDTVQSNRSLLFSGFKHAWIKLGEGCNRSCGFCAIPLMRGKQRSRDEQEIVDEAKMLFDQGIRELIVIMQDPVNFGIDTVNTRRLIPILQKFESIGFDWIRVQYLFPDPLLVELSSFYASSSVFCNYIDVPLQHVSQNVLKKMNRPGDYESLLRLIEQIKNANPKIAIRSSFIAGYPGETQFDADQISKFLMEAKLDRVGFFTYSHEENTRSYEMPNQVPHGVAQDRVATWAELQQKISTKRLERFVGQNLICIGEGVSEENEEHKIMIMRTEFDAPEIDGIVRVKVPKSLETELIEMAEVKITGSDNHDLEAKFVREV